MLNPPYHRFGFLNYGLHLPVPETVGNLTGDPTEGPYVTTGSSLHRLPVTLPENVNHHNENKKGN